ncbi:MAG: hypothetical protein OHK0017_00930 [Patescibacteria group bacterium]
MSYQTKPKSKQFLSKTISQKLLKGGSKKKDRSGSKIEIRKIVPAGSTNVAKPQNNLKETNSEILGFSIWNYLIPETQLNSIEEFITKIESNFSVNIGSVYRSDPNVIPFVSNPNNETRKLEGAILQLKRAYLASMAELILADMGLQAMEQYYELRVKRDEYGDSLKLIEDAKIYTNIRIGRILSLLKSYISKNRFISTKIETQLKINNEDFNEFNFTNYSNNFIQGLWRPQILRMVNSKSAQEVLKYIVALLDFDRQIDITLDPDLRVNQALARPSKPSNLNDRRR